MLWIRLFWTFPSNSQIITKNNGKAYKNNRECIQQGFIDVDTLFVTMGHGLRPAERPSETLISLDSWPAAGGSPPHLEKFD